MPPEISYRNLTIPRDIVEFYRSFDYRFIRVVSSSYSADYPTTFRFETAKKKIKTLDIE